MKFGDNLRNLRKSKKLSQEDLAEKMKVSRQSVSKWETGDAYPEMNNILELCKIFHCHINDLVNDGIIDVDSLDEEIKMNVVKFKKDQQNKMKGLSKAIYTIAKICKVIVIICIPIVVATMILLAVALSKVDITDGNISIDGKDPIAIIEESDNISVKVDDLSLAEVNDSIEIIKIKEFITNNPKHIVMLYVETGLGFVIIYLILTSFMLNYLEKLFKNINQGDTPFTLENVKYIKNIAYLMIAVTVLPNIAGVIFQLITKTNLNVGLELFTLIEILFLFSIAYIFQYGYEIQLDSKGKMYDTTNE